MNGPHPTVRYLIVCEDVLGDPEDGRKVTPVNLISAIRSLDEPPYPLRYRELCAFVQLTECRGPADARVEIVQADTDAVVFQTRTRAVFFPADPLVVAGISFRIRSCLFPAAGLYWVRFVYNEAPIAQQALLLR